MRPGSIFVCTHCDAQFSKWIGRCLECGQWSTIVEQKNTPTAPPRRSAAEPLATRTLNDIAESMLARRTTGIGECDRVLGGGIVPGSFLLLGGEPGIGKSTLALHIAVSVPNTLYVSGEESAEQIKMRAVRLGVKGTDLRIAHAQDTDAIVATIETAQPSFVVVDSMQTISTQESPGEAGSVSQIRASAAKLLEEAKRSGTAILIIGHVTKDGALAGPKTLEHMVDTVLSFEGDPHRGIRLLRTLKNRFGSTDEIGLFDMAGDGLVEITDPSKCILEGRATSVPGSVLTCVIEGTRPLIVEIQALVTKTSFGYPVRKVNGFDVNRLHLLLAILQKRAGLNFSEYDIHVNVAGGMSAKEPAADIAVALALASAYKEKILGADLVAFGEVGIAGELKSVSHTEKRLAAAKDLGLSRVILPKTARGISPPSGIQAMEVANLNELIAQT